jgi:hypothetical protein
VLLQVKRGRQKRWSFSIWNKGEITIFFKKAPQRKVVELPHDVVVAL